MRKCEERGKIDLGSHTNARVYLCVPVFVNVCMPTHVCVNIVSVQVCACDCASRHTCLCVSYVCVHAPVWLM